MVQKNLQLHRERATNLFLAGLKGNFVIFEISLIILHQNFFCV